MHVPRVRRTLALAVVAALSVITLAGCAALPSAPTSTGAASAIEAGFVRAPGDAGLGSELIGGVTGQVTGLVQSTLQSITGSSGGVVTAGRFSVEVPPGAFTGTGDISVEVPDSTLLVVNLHIAQVPNKFDVPVKLVVSFAGLEGNPDTNPEYFKIFWFDEEAKQWRMMTSVVDLDQKTVSTELRHFSTYGVLEAKAGW